MKANWRAAFGLLIIIEGLICLAGSAAAQSGSPAILPNAVGGEESRPSFKRKHGRPATVAYTFGFAGQINEYSTVPADNGTLVGTLTLPAPYVAAQFATDRNGRIYVAACGSASEAAEVFVYPPNSTGTDAPSYAIEIGTCENGVSDIWALAVDPTGRYLYVETLNPTTISEYSATASGAPPAIRTLQLPTGFSYGYLAAADANGNIFVAGDTSASVGVISVYGPHATGSDAPIRTITLENEQPDGLAVDANGHIFASVYNDATAKWDIEEFAAGADGLASPTNTINLPPLPPDDWSNSAFVRLDAASNIFASLIIYNLQNSPTHVIYGFVPTATGQAAPAVTITTNDDIALFAVN